MNNLIVKNEGNIDRIIRVVIGLVLIILPLVTDITKVLIIPGVILLGTGVVGTCLLYRLVGLSTCPVDIKKK